MEFVVDIVVVFLEQGTVTYIASHDFKDRLPEYGDLLTLRFTEDKDGIDAEGTAVIMGWGG